MENLTWFGWYLIIANVLNMIYTAYLIGRPRKPVDEYGLFVTIVIGALLILGVVTIGTHN